MQGFQPGKYVCIFIVIKTCTEQYLLFLWGNVWTVARKPALLYIITRGQHLIVFTQISQEKKKITNLVFFSLGVL